MLPAGVQRPSAKGAIVTNRSVVAVIVLSILTLGIYSIVWLVKNKGEMVRAGADIPTSWLLIVPFASIWYLWKWSGGVEHVTGGKLTQVISFILLFVLGSMGLGIIGMAIVQAELNKAIDRGVPGQLPVARVA
jgi:hypothetical protein